MPGTTPDVRFFTKTGVFIVAEKYGDGFCRYEKRKENTCLFIQFLSDLLIYYIVK